MYFWFQNLNEDKKQLFHFRGSVGRTYKKNWFKYEISSGWKLALKYSHGNHDDSSTLQIGLIFFALYLTFHLPERFYFKRKCVATWDNNREFYLIEGREYGFYFYDWAFVWSFHAKSDESNSSDPWWMRQYIHLDELIFGRPESIRDELISNENVFFEIGNKKFKMDSIQWLRYRRFRRFIPYSLYHTTSYSVDMKIAKPPMYSGKGENSWDCGDDGTYGIHGPWNHEIPTYKNREECTKKAIDYYIKSVMKNAERYGGSDSENGIRKGLPYTYIGREIDNSLTANTGTTRGH